MNGKDIFSFLVTDSRDALRRVPSGSPKKTGRPGSLRRHASPREERFAEFVQSAQFALQSVGVVPMTEAQAKPGHPAQLDRDADGVPKTSRLNKELLVELSRASRQIILLTSQ